MLAVHGALAALWIWILLARPRTGWSPVTAPTAAFTAFLALALAGAAMAPYRYGAFTLIQELAAFTAVALLASRCGPRLCNFLALPVLAAASLQGAYVLVQRFALDMDRPAGTFFNTNHLGAWLAAAVLLGLGTYENTPDRRTRMLRIGLAVPALAGLLASTSRGAFLGLVAGTVWLVILLWRKISARQRTALVVTACILGIAAGAMLVQRFRTVDPYALHRVQIWQSSLSIIQDRPWLGTGPGQFASTAEGYQFADGTPPLDYDRIFRRPHSDWLRPPGEFGIPTTVVLLLALVLTVRAMRGRDRSGIDAGALAALVALAAHGAVENLSERPAIYLLAAALLGALVSRKKASQEPAEDDGTVRAVRALACVVLVVVFLAGDVAPYRAWRYGKAGDVLGACRFNPLQPFLHMRQAESLADEGFELDLVYYAWSRETAERAVRLHPREGSLRLRLARIEALACRRLFGDLQSRTRAAARYLDAEKLSRPTALIPLEAGEFLYGTSDFRGAVAAADRAIALEPEAPAPLLLKARALLQIGGGDAAGKARDLLDRALELEARYAAVPRQNEYSRLLLDLDPDTVRWIGERLLDVPQRP
jgi:O-antigen ligase